MIEINHLKLQLPAQYQDQASVIAREVTQLLAQASFQKSIQGNHHIQRLSIGPIECSVGQTQGQLSQQIAKAIHSGIRGQQS